MSRARSFASVLATATMAIILTGCASRPSVTASGDHAGLVLDMGISAASDSLLVETTVRNTRAVPVHLDADQCGRVTDVFLVRTVFEPEGAVYAGSLDALKRLVLEQQRNNQSDDRFAPRRVSGGSETPDCVRPTRPITIAPGGSIAEHWELPFASAYGLAAVGSEHETVRAQAVEAVAADKLGFIDILPEAQAQDARAGRVVTAESPASAVLTRPATHPNTDPSLGQRFDRMIENATVRTFIEAQPADSWREGNITPTTADALRFRAVTTAYERPLDASLARDGSVVGDASLPGPVDRSRTFERRPATLPPGIAVIPEPDTPTLTEDVIAGRLDLPSGRVVADGMSGDAKALPDVARPGDYPVFVTVARSPGSRYESVAFASLVVSDAPTVSWVARGAVAVDGGTAGFVSVEGEALLDGTSPDASEDPVTAAFDSLTAHDNIVTEMQIGEGSNLVLFSTGYGDGSYGVYVGLDGDGRPTRFVLDCAIVHLDWPTP